jgi:hypothetical protein
MDKPIMSDRESEKQYHKRLLSAVLDLLHEVQIMVNFGGEQSLYFTNTETCKQNHTKLVDEVLKQIDLVPYISEAFKKAIESK